METVVIIGASRGIGLELARQYAADGYRVHATTRTPDAPGQLGELEGEVVLHELDVCRLDQIRDLRARLAGEQIDILIHNAGVKGDSLDREQVMAINAEAPIAVCEALLDRMAPAGKLVLISSQLGARRGRTHSLGLYGDSKAALNDAFRARAEAWRDHGVIAIVLHPGWVRTDMGGASAPVCVSQSAAGIRAVAASVDNRSHGAFLTWQGEVHPW